MNMRSVEKLCDLCQHRHPDSHPPSCAAYPDRIPLEIRLMQVDHRQPYAGDHGICFEPVTGTADLLTKMANLVWKPSTDSIGELQRRVAGVLEWIPFSNLGERQLFGLAVKKANSFAELPPEAQNLILAGEQVRQASQHSPSATVSAG